MSNQLSDLSKNYRHIAHCQFYQNHPHTVILKNCAVSEASRQFIQNLNLKIDKDKRIMSDVSLRFYLINSRIIVAIFHDQCSI